jgi:hypothetical protein
MKEPGEIEIHASRRMLKNGTAVCGSIVTGTDKVRSGYGNGDCLYFDFNRGVFAIADATERFPWASRDLLNRLSEILSLRGTPDTARGWKELMDADVYSAQKYQHKTTFSCVAVRREGEGARMVIVHGGDSVVTVMNSTDGSILHQTGPDMNFAGRSLEITDVSEHRFDDPGTRVIISSDGFGDLFRFCLKHALIPSMAEVFAGNTLEGVCCMIHDILDRNRGRFEYDDIGFILIDPCSAALAGGAEVLIGGTRPQEERRFRDINRADCGERWIPRREWRGHEEMFSEIGITYKEN